MSVASLLVPVFVQMALTLALMFWMASHRVAAVRSGVVRPKDIALREPNWPARATQIANCFHNQLELPMLFYVLVALILITSTNSAAFVILAWAFVASRLVHAYIHTGSNRIDHRFYAMATGMVILTVMWVIFAARVLTAEGL
ncbi:MAG TPA: MAPEG family protein [Hyphomicrobium sp.]|jgi:hypothetical protein